MMILAGMFGRKGGGSPPITTYAGYDPAKKGTNATLGDSNFAVQTLSAGLARWALSLTGKTSGKFHVQFVHTAQADTMGSGIAFDTSIGSYMGATVSSAGVFGNYGSSVRFYYNNTFTAYSYTMTVGDVMDCWIDIDAGRVWWGKNGVPFSGSPSAGTGAMFTFTPGRLTYLISDTTGANSKITLRKGDQNSGGAVAGFTEGWPV